MEISFIGKKVLVTGAGRGIGRELAKQLVKSGATVTALSKVKSQLETLKAECPGIITITADITSSNIKDIIKPLGPFDCLVNNAGVALLEPFLEATESSFDESFNVNIKAAFIISQLVAKQMIEHGIKGSIVNMSSQASKVALWDHAVYCSSKSALDMMSKVMALELGEYGIRVNCVNPTVVLTAMGKLGWSDPNKANPLKARIPLHKFAEVDDVINAVIFLLSDKANMINAVTLPVDGGFWAT